MDYTTFGAIIISVAIISNGLVEIAKKRTRNFRREMRHLKQIDKLKNEVMDMKIQIADLSTEVQKKEVKDQ